MWYHVSFDYLGESTILKPKIPNIIYAPEREIEGNIPRVCVSLSIYNCLKAKIGEPSISTLDWKDIPENPCVYFTEDVPFIPPACSDFRVNDERWFLMPTKFYYLGRVDMYKLFTKSIIQPTEEVAIKLPRDIKNIRIAKEIFLQKCLTSNNKDDKIKEN